MGCCQVLILQTLYVQTWMRSPVTACVRLGAAVRAGLRTGFVRQRWTADSIAGTGHGALLLTVSLHKWNASRERDRDGQWGEMCLWNVLGGTCVYFCCVCVYLWEWLGYGDRNVLDILMTVHLFAFCFISHSEHNGQFSII